MGYLAAGDARVVSLVCFASVLLSVSVFGWGTALLISRPLFNPPSVDLTKTGDMWRFRLRNLNESPLPYQPSHTRTRFWRGRPHGDPRVGVRARSGPNRYSGSPTWV